MKKIICFLCFLLAVAIIASLCGGCSSNTSEYKETKYTRFIVVSESEGPWNFTKIIADRETGVLYLQFSNGYRGGITPLLNTDGSPMIWENWEGN